MSPLLYQFRARLTFTFREHDVSRRRWFMFESHGHRRVPMRMDRVEGLSTLGMWHDGAATFHEGEEAVVECILIDPAPFVQILKPGVAFELWDGGFFAKGEVEERHEEGWPTFNPE